ncbi:MAG TPA: histidine kinase, partial [Puia sp.]|nr:histidine kinase [Puia sp.]
QYTSQDGLGSDIVNVIFADRSTLYVGTPAGLSFFDETKIDLSEGCRLYLLSVVNSGKERIGDTSGLMLPYTDKSIRLEFAGISYRSVGGISYRYRLMGLDTSWRTTKEAFLEYPTLPSGRYELQLQAFNKFGVSSALLSLHFGVVTPFWQATWFYGLILAAFLLLTWLFVSLRIAHIRNREKEKEQLSQRMMEMEHTALQAQMNPHFIFNCLNSIQQYIFDQDIFAANKYISGFAKLIRATLQNSSKPFISLPDEISYLSGYLSLEKLRFKEKMDYSIEVDQEINDEVYIIPPMLIQPYVENSMRHGLRHKAEGKGFITIKFRKAGDRLYVTVEDNGIGRKKAGSFKTREHIEYQSKGMSLTADRIRMMNAKYNDSILIDVIDLEDVTGKATGTRVIMEFPLFHILLENQVI